jgi:hypothetical protein
MKVIRATLTVEVPYTNDVMNNGSLLDKELRKVIDKTDFLNCKTVACDEDAKDTLPIIR